MFDLGTALWFNEQFVTTEVASPEDLETILEVGSWTWGWMEPPMGQLSFFLLCLQWSRQQLINVQVCVCVCVWGGSSSHMRQEN